MQIKEAFTVFSYVGFLIEDFESRQKNLSLDERADIIEKIGKEIDKEDKLVLQTRHVEKLVIKAAEDIIKAYDEHRQKCVGRPMMLNDGRKVQKWIDEQLEEQKLNFIMKNIRTELEKLDVAKTVHEMAAMLPIKNWYCEQLEKLISQYEDRNRALAIKTAIELRKHGVPVTKVKI